MVNPQVGYQPRTTPAERRADLNLARQARADVAAAVDDLHADPGTFTGPITVTVDEPATNYTSNKTSTANVDGATHMSIRSAGTEIGRITRATSTTAGFLTTSDEDLKDNIYPIDTDLAMLWMRTIQPYFFNYKEVPDVRHVGYMAQRVAEQWPNGVRNGVVVPGHGDIDDRTWDEDGNETTPPGVWQAWMMDHAKTTPILHSCLRHIDDTLEARGTVIDEHAARIAALEAQVAALIDTVTAQNDAVDHLRAEIFYTRQMTADWQYSNTTTANPGTGQLRTNVGATIMWLHRIDTDGMDRKAALDFLVAATTDQADSVRFRIRGATGTVVELRTNGRAVDNGTYYTVPIAVISGDPTNKGFRVEITMLSEIWAEDPPPRPTLLPT